MAIVLGPIGELRAHALAYAEAGLEVFPANPSTKAPLTASGMKDATTNLERIEAWWDQHPGALIAHRIPPDVVVVDVDPRHGGDVVWKTIRAELGGFPITRAHASGRGDGGGHIWWLRPDDKLTTRPLDQWARDRQLGENLGNGHWTAGIDLLHHGHRYTILPPSPHPDSGQPYQWIDGRGLDIPPAPMPGMLADLLTDDTPPAPAPPPRPPDPDSIADWYTDHHTWTDLLPRHGWTLIAGDGHSDGSRWRHPRATAAYSATIRHRCLFVYSPNTPFEETTTSEPHGYTLFRAWARLDHSGDLTVAARHARELHGPASNPNDLTWIPAPVTATNGNTPPADDTEFDWRTLIIDGRTWLTEGPDQPEALWGDERAVLWAKSQPLVIAGPQGAGKTVFGQQLALGHLGIVDTLLDWPVTPGDGNALYLAADRPEQARLSMRRMVNDDHHETLHRRLRVWRGPPPYDFAKNTRILREMADAAQADLIVLDSLKDVALKLSDDEVGAAVNRAIQMCIADGIDVISLHHPRKLSGADHTDKPRNLDDLYGSVWLTSGAGSVIYLGVAEIGTHELAQFKSPIGTMAETHYQHDHQHGHVTTAQPPDLLAIVEEAGDEGITVDWAAKILHRLEDIEPKHRKATSRKLAGLAEEGLVEKVTGQKRGAAARWRAT